MERCVECRSTALVEGPQETESHVGRRMFRGHVHGWRCDACGEVYYAATGLLQFEHLVALWIASHGFAGGGTEMRRLRLQLGLRAVDLAKLFDVTPETVSHWETGKTKPDLRTRQTLAALVLDQEAGVTTTRDRLAGLLHPPTDRTIDLSERVA